MTMTKTEKESEDEAWKLIEASKQRMNNLGDTKNSDYDSDEEGDYFDDERSVFTNRSTHTTHTKGSYFSSANTTTKRYDDYVQQGWDSKSKAYDEDDDDDDDETVASLLSKSSQRLNAVTEEGKVRTSLLLSRNSEVEDEDEEDDEEERNRVDATTSLLLSSEKDTVGDNSNINNMVALNKKVKEAEKRGESEKNHVNINESENNNYYYDDDDASIQATEANLRPGEDDEDDDDDDDDDDEFNSGELLEGFPTGGTRRKSIKTIVQEELEEEIQKYSKSERELLVSLVIAEEAARGGESDFKSAEISKREEFQEELAEMGGMDAIVDTLCRDRLAFADEEIKVVMVYEDQYILLTNVSLTLKHYFKPAPTARDEEDEDDYDNRSVMTNIANNHKVIPLHTIERVWLGTQCPALNNLLGFNKPAWGPSTFTNIDWASCNDKKLRNDNKNNFVLLCNDIFDEMGKGSEEMDNTNNNQNKNNNNKQKRRDGFTVENPEPVQKALAKYIIYENTTTNNIANSINERIPIKLPWGS